MKSKIYTKKGDRGETSLVSGKRISKSEERINLYGEVDELNSYIGLLISEIEQNFKIEKKLLITVQSALFDLGSNLACEKDNREKYKLPQVKSNLIEELEKHIDEMDKKLPKLNTFILPGGAKAASLGHVCRTVTRRVERKLVEYERSMQDEVENALIFLNRLSDYFFILSRYINHEMNVEEIKWIPNN